MPTGSASPVAAPQRSKARAWGLAGRVLIILLFVLATNAGFRERIDVVVEQGRLTTLVGFLGLWGISAVCLIIAALQPNAWVRAFWAFVIAFATAVGFAFRQA